MSSDLETFFPQAKVSDYKEKCRLMEERLLEVNELSNDSQVRLLETTDVLKGLEDKLKASEVSQ